MRSVKSASTVIVETEFCVLNLLQLSSVIETCSGTLFHRGKTYTTAFVGVLHQQTCALGKSAIVTSHIIFTVLNLGYCFPHLCQSSQVLTRVRLLVKNTNKGVVRSPKTQAQQNVEAEFCVLNQLHMFLVTAHAELHYSPVERRRPPPSPLMSKLQVLT